MTLCVRMAIGLCAALGSSDAFLATVETIVVMKYFNERPDHLQAGEATGTPDETLLLPFLAVSAGTEGFSDRARFGEREIDLLRRFRPFAKGTRSHDQPGDLFAALGAPAFRWCFGRPGFGADPDPPRGRGPRRTQATASRAC
jgi:hypothetical protein